MLPLLMSSVEPATLTSLTSPTVCVFVQWSWHEMTLAAGGCPLEVVALVMWSSVKGGVLMNGGGESTSFMERGCAIEQWVCACVLRPVLWLWSLLFLFFLRSLPKKSQCPPQVYPPFSNRVCVLRNVSGLSRRLRPERLSNPSSLSWFLQPVLECAVQRGLVYNKVNPIFHHWRVEDRKFGLTFQSPAEAISFERGLQSVLDKLERGT